MATLNARKSLREKSTIHDTSLSLRDISPSGGGATANLSAFSPTVCPRLALTSNGSAVLTCGPRRSATSRLASRSASTPRRTRATTSTRRYAAVYVALLGSAEALLPVGQVRQFRQARGYRGGLSTVSSLPPPSPELAPHAAPHRGPRHPTASQLSAADAEDPIAFSPFHSTRRSPSLLFFPRCAARSRRRSDVLARTALPPHPRYIVQAHTIALIPAAARAVISP